MINKSVLEEAGLTENEAQVYLILLNIGEATIYQIADKVKISRPNIYDVVKTLKEKGLVSEMIKKNIKHFKAITPEKLLEIIQRKEKNFLEILPELNTLYKTTEKKPVIEVFQGKEGLMTLMNDMIKTKKQILIFNQMTKKLFKKYISQHYAERFFKEKNNFKIKTRALYSHDEAPIKAKGYTVKKISKENLGNVGYWIYGDRVGIGIWTEEIIIIRIISEDVARIYRKSFELIWKGINAK